MNRELCRQCQRSAATELNDQPYQRLPTDPEGPEQLSQHGRQPGQYLRALAGRQCRWNDPVENQIGESEGGQPLRDTPSADE